MEIIRKIELVRKRVFEETIEIIDVYDADILRDMGYEDIFAVPISEIEDEVRYVKADKTYDTTSVTGGTRRPNP
ncbi:hypothetical protein KW795_01075 [Candidatus Microgenomates bacterium]|nr:hypothetical protein [Candidatus Microgenomates bacterium]